MASADTVAGSAAKSRVPAVEGWFRIPPDAVPGSTDIALVGTRCVGSGTYFFPPERVRSRVPGHGSSALEEVELSRRGTLWSYTDARYQPPPPFVAPTDPYEPYCLAAVELAAERMVVLGQVVAGVTVDDLRVGQEMELVVDVLDEDDEHEYLVWKWRPVTDGSGGPA
jgi:uncharacterized OB-fold protein